MNEYKFQMRRKKRGDHCLATWRPEGGLCGCGGRNPPLKKHKTRIVKRTLANQLRKEINDSQH